MTTSTKARLTQCTSANDVFHALGELTAPYGASVVSVKLHCHKNILRTVVCAVETKDHAHKVARSIGGYVLGSSAACGNFFPVTEEFRCQGRRNGKLKQKYCECADAPAADCLEGHTASATNEHSASGATQPVQNYNGRCPVISEQPIDQACEQQVNAIPDSATRKFGSAILLATSSLGLAAVPLPVAAGPGVAVVSVRAMVSPTVKMQFESSSMQLSITEEDIARGYIDVPGTNRLTLNSDRSAQQLANISLDYEPDPYNFSSIQLATTTLPAADRNADSGLAGSINALPGSAAGPSDPARQGMQDDAGSTAPAGANSASARGSVTSFGYRLMLPKSIKPGDLSVPVTLNIQL